MLGTDDTAADNAATSLLYAGEQYDSDLSHYYLRARYYNPWSGTFNRTDPFAGNNSDPQSLHKYLYCHANPVNMIDPSGEFSLPQLLFAIALIGILAGIFFYQRRSLSSASDNYQNDILAVKCKPIIVTKDDDRYNVARITDPERRDLEEGLTATSEFWKRVAGIELKWDAITFIRSNELANLEDLSEVNNAVSKYYTNSPVVLAVETIEEITSGATARSRNGFAIRKASPGHTISHEFGHLFIGLRHVYGNPTNLMAAGMENQSSELSELFLTQKQVDKARKYVKERKWAIE